MSSPVFADNVQNSVFQVLSEGFLKAGARPVFTLIDKNGTPESRKYSATKELIFQTLSMVFYFAIVMTMVQKGGYRVIRQIIKKNPKLANNPDFEMCLVNKTRKDFLDKRQAAVDAVNAAKDTVEKAKAIAHKNKFIQTKGVMEFVNILGSGVILTILAPKVVMKMLHPIMGAVDKHQKSKKASKEQKSGDTFQKAQK